MKIQLLSDIHQECKPRISFSKNDISSEAELIIVPGDFHYLHLGIEFLTSCLYDHQQAIYVPGNHEYYHSTMSCVNRLVNKQLKTNEYPVHLLNNSIWVLNEFEFMGTTLWTDYNLFGNVALARMSAELAMNDFKLIQYNKQKKWTSSLAEETHKKSLQWLSVELKKKKNKSKKKIVVTHHSPCIKSSQDQFMNHIVTSSFASSLESFIVEHDPLFWFHGHVHNSKMYTINNTTIAVNAKGYENERTNYIPHYLIDIVK